MRRITCALVTLRAPSVNATAPRPSTADLGHFLAAQALGQRGIGWMLTIAVSRARRSTKSTVAECRSRLGVGLADDGGDAAGRRRLARGGKVSRGQAWLADKGAHVDEAGAMIMRRN